MSNLTDNEIEMALEYCTNPKVGKECPRAKFVDVCNDGCINILMRQAYELIIRKNAEIEILNRKGNNMNIHDMTEEAYKNGYEKGVKDFAQKLRKECHTDFQGFYVVLIDQITALEEKMIGSQEKSKMSNDYSFEIGV